jgi:hypothetical protein
MAFDTAGSLIYIARNYRIAAPTATAVSRVVRRPNGDHVIGRDVTVGPVGLQPQPIALDAPEGLVFVGYLDGDTIKLALLVLDTDTLATLHTVSLSQAHSRWRRARGAGSRTSPPPLDRTSWTAGPAPWRSRSRPAAHRQGFAVDQTTGVAYIVDRLDHTPTRVEVPLRVTAAHWQ